MLSEHIIFAMLRGSNLYTFKTPTNVRNILLFISLDLDLFKLTILLVKSTKEPFKYQRTFQVPNNFLSTKEKKTKNF